MVEPVDKIIPDFASAGTSIITFYPEASRHIDRSLHITRDEGCESGLVFNPATQLSYLEYVMDKVDVRLESVVVLKLTNFVKSKQRVLIGLLQDPQFLINLITNK